MGQAAARFGRRFLSAVIVFFSQGDAPKFLGRGS
jgi:hypothetical protein